jgi:hypothetical protein
VETEGGVHLHHLVWGICIMLAAGFLGVRLDFDYPWAASWPPCSAPVPG